jgi:uncharacterized repeat protein (TIGR02543 family)
LLKTPARLLQAGYFRKWNVVHSRFKERHEMSRSSHFIHALILAAGLVALLADPRPAAAALGSFANSTPITIQDNAPGTPYPSTITVSGLVGRITKVTAKLSNLNHEFAEDIDILLVGPGDQKVLLVSDVGADGDLLSVTLVLDDAATVSLPGAGRITSGTFRPTNLRDSNTLGTSDEFPAPAPAPPYGTALSRFNGTNPNGEWRLFVKDDSRLSAGSLAGGWCLTITTDAPEGGGTTCTPTLTIVNTGPGQVTSVPPGLDCSGTCAAVFDFGSTVTLSALPAPGFVFTGWSGGGGGCVGTGDCSVLLTTADISVTANFAPIPLGSVALTIGSTIGGTVTSTPDGIDCGIDCVETYPAGTAVTLTATPATGFAFTGWSGGCAGTGDCVVTLLADTIVAATFAPLPGHFALSVVKAGPGLGTVAGLPAGILCGTNCVAAYPGGTVITLRETRRRGSLFGGWIGGGCAETAPCSVTLNGDTTVTAVFTAPSDRPVILEPLDDDAPLTAGTEAIFRWTPVPGASQYGFEFTGTNLGFFNPGGTAPDDDNGFGGAGGGFPVVGTNLSIMIPAGIPPGAYQVRVVGLTPGLAFVGRFSEAVTVLVGALPGGQPALTADRSVIPLGEFVAFTWSAVPDATQYLFEFTGPDPGGIGGTFIIADTSLPAVVPTDIPAGPYRIRVLGLTDGGAPVGQFSPALTVVLQ